MPNTCYRFKLLTLLMLLALPFGLSGALAEEHGEHGGEKSKKEGDERLGENTYVHLSPLVLPVINENGAQQLVTLVIDLQVKDFNAADTIHSNMPRVQDAIMT